MGNISNIRVRMRELAVQASNGTLGTEDRAAIQTEVTALVSQIGDIAERTTFNGTDLLEGGASIDIQTGVNSGEKVTIAIADLQANAIGEVDGTRSEEHTSELQSLMRISYAVFCLNTKKNIISK